LVPIVVPMSAVEVSRRRYIFLALSRDSVKQNTWASP
jgi:hypothetical protein